MRRRCCRASKRPTVNGEAASRMQIKQELLAIVPNIIGSKNKGMSWRVHLYSFLGKAQSMRADLTSARPSAMACRLELLPPISTR